MGAAMELSMRMMSTLSWMQAEFKAGDTSFTDQVLTTAKKKNLGTDDAAIFGT
jgi:hypothetical protein